MINFAFGSNMALARIRARLPHVQCLGKAKLVGYQLTFDMLAKDDSAKCSLRRTDYEQDIAWGVAYALSEEEEAILDQIEGPYYDRHEVVIQMESGEMESAYCYIANRVDHGTLPYDWYVNHVYQGAVEHDFPIHYCQSIKHQACKKDPLSSRAQQEFKIYKK